MSVILSVIILLDGNVSSSYHQPDAKRPHAAMQLPVRDLNQCHEVARIVQADLDYWRPNVYTLEYTCEETNHAS